MPQVSINLWSVVLAAVSQMVLGAVWYSSALFAKPWAKAAGRKMEELAGGSVGGVYAIAAGAALVEAYILAHFIAFVGATTLSQGIQTGFWAWLGFVVPVVGVTTLFEGKTKELFAITAGYHLVSLLVMGAILTNHSHVIQALPPIY